ncbi:hypothetical protein CEE45_00375 [Candidatus Heimdallarchaeota archaeon B3_Heim]|nr:MAG: hypothetical protein CEE45_00375 [Candidatus Heimdallarchaeota archaeon B3_Heim]
MDSEIVEKLCKIAVTTGKPSQLSWKGSKFDDVKNYPVNMKNTLWEYNKLLSTVFTSLDSYYIHKTSIDDSIINTLIQLLESLLKNLPDDHIKKKRVLNVYL